MTAYCSIMTLLLAFFIILQAFSSVRGDGLFYAGKGSFVRALETFGLGGVWERMGGDLTGDMPRPHYKAPEGNDQPPRERRIDVEREEARRALQTLHSNFDVREPPHGAGWRVTLPTPFSFIEWDGTFGPRHEEFCAMLADHLEPLVTARGFVIRVTAVVDDSKEFPLEQVIGAMNSAEKVRRKIVEKMSSRGRRAARNRIYTFCRRRQPTGDPSTYTGSYLRVNVMLTKPYLKQLTEGGVRESEQQDDT
jgi:hypothetical protein